MKSKASFVWVLIGVIFGFLGSLIGIGQYFMFKSVGQGVFSEFYNIAGVNFQVLMLLSLISSIIGLILSLVLIFYLVKLARNPTKTDCIVTAVLGGLGIFLGMGIGGILVVIGGIIGIVKSNQLN